MQKLKIVALLAFLLLSSLSKGQQDESSVFERRITINQQNQTLGFILEQISWQAGIFFSYDASIINAEKKYSLNTNNKSIFTVLNKLLPPEVYQLQELQNQIIITKQQADKLKKKANNNTIQPKYFFLSGKLLNKKNSNPVPYATISLLGKPIGTISNTDGNFILKLHPKYIRDTLIISSMGYRMLHIPAHRLLDEDLFLLEEISIRIKEVKVTTISTKQLLKNLRNNLRENYSSNSKLMTSFYRETVKQDKTYISVSEGVMQILKTPYTSSRNDLVRIVKGRKSPDIKPFKWLNFKLQGGPFNITRLDVIKSIESFINEKYEPLYKYSVTKVLWFKEYPVYRVKFNPVSTEFFPMFEGEMYVHRETFALIHADFRLSKPSLKKSTSLIIKKKPRKIKARPTLVNYKVTYQYYQNKWQLLSAQASVKVKVKNKRDKINAEFHSISDLLVTNIEPTLLKRFSKSEKFSQYDIFVEELGQYDEKFWENYNIIKPTDKLQKAFKKASVQ